MKKQNTKLMKIFDFSLEGLIALEEISERKIKIFNEHRIGSSQSFSSLLNTMLDEQSEELRVIQDTILTVSRAKQIICTHPKKDQDVCDGTMYCMNCTLTLLS